jgi:hypothetical protein
VTGPGFVSHFSSHTTNTLAGRGALGGRHGPCALPLAAGLLPGVPAGPGPVTANKN